MDGLFQDVKTALHVWRNRPLAALAGILTIALGSGMNTALLALTWTVFLTPLRLPDAAQLVQIWIDDGKEPRTAPRNSVIEKWRDSSRSLTGIASYRPWRVTVVSGGEPEQVFGALVSANFFATLGEPLLIGRDMSESELKAGSDNTVILRESYWRRRFAADRTIAGRQIIVDGTLCTVAGIVGDSFAGATLVQGARRGADAERGAKAEPVLYLPISRARVGMGYNVTTSFVVGRLQPNVTLKAARQELIVIAGADERRPIWLSHLRDEIGLKIRPAVLALGASTGFVLLIACANMANLLMGHALMRRRELALRSALGAGRNRIIRQLLIEAILLLMAGSAAGIFAAQAISRVITTLYPNAIPHGGGDPSEWLAYAVASGLTLVIGSLFGLLPAWRAAGEAGDESLRVSTPWMSRSNRRWADALVAVQMGLAAVVLIAAGLLLESFFRLSGVDLGITKEHAITASVDLPVMRFKSAEDRARFGQAWIERLQAIPGVSAAGISNSLPLRYTTLLDVVLRIPGQASNQAVGGRAVGGDYFTAIGTNWVSGKPFDDQRKDEIVVNEAFVRRYLRNTEPVGTVLGAGKQMLTITGVVHDVRHIGLQQPAVPEVFMPFAAFPLNPVDTVVRSNLPPEEIETAMRRELRAVDAQLALGRVMTMQDVIDDNLARPRFQALLLVLFAAVAVALAAVGAYAVVAQNIRSRIPELGLRRALGAGTTDLLRLVVFGGMKAPIAGLLTGMLLSIFIVGRFLAKLLYGVASRDVTVFIATAAILTLTSLMACAFPGRTAVRVEPSCALRQG